MVCGQLSTVTLHAADRYGNAHVSGGEEVTAQLRGGPSRGIPSTVKVPVPILACCLMQATQKHTTNTRLYSLPACMRRPAYRGLSNMSCQLSFLPASPRASLHTI